MKRLDVMNAIADLDENSWVRREEFRKKSEPIEAEAAMRGEYVEWELDVHLVWQPTFHKIKKQ